MQHLNNDFNKLKVDDSTHVKMLTIQEMWQNSLNHSNIITKYLVACVLKYFNKYKMKFLSNGLNILKINGSTLIIEEMWKKSLSHFNH
jgi:hypothetical protein